MTSQPFLFRFNDALRDQLVSTFDGMAPSPLDPAHIALVARTRGVYRLHHPTPAIAYIGKADDLRGRLEAHRNKISGRTGIALADLGFSCLYIEDSLMTASPEGVLIAHYRRHGGLPWNGSGFGNRDRGQDRDRESPTRWDGWFPIDLAHPSGIPPGTYSADDVIARLQPAAGIPYLVRVQSDPLAMADRVAATVTIAASLSVEEVVEALAAELNRVSAPGTPPWNGAALAAAIVLYKTTVPYPHNLRTF